MSSSRRHTNLPLPLTRFIGRDIELAEVRSKLETERLITLTGPGGVGKTRLALEVASCLPTDVYSDGIWLVELASLNERRLVPQAVAIPLGVRADAQADLEHSLLTFLRPKRLLLVLDNCEHLVDACARLADMLLRACAGLQILATSREPLRISGEWVSRVGPLPAPVASSVVTADQLLGFASVRLFLDRVSAASHFELTDRVAPTVASVCERLDGIPLALELAAARVATLGLVELDARLDDALSVLVGGSRSGPERHQTLQATIDWSYGLLGHRERQVLDRLCVFAGGFFADSVEAVVADAQVPASDVLDILSALVEKSLVVAEPLPNGSLRYRLQEVVHQYGSARLSRRAELDALRSRHATFFSELVQRAEPEVLRGARERWQGRLELDLDNFRAARAWLMQHAETESALRLTAYLFLLLAYRGYVNEGRASLSETLAMPGGSSATRGRALHCLALLAYLQADYRAAATYGEASLELRREAANPGELAWSLLERGSTANAQADYAVAEQYLAECRQASQQGGSGYLAAYSLGLLAHVAYQRGDLQLARERAEQALALGRKAAFIAPTSHALATLGELATAEGDYEAASLAMSSALERAGTGEVYLVGRPLLGLALIAIDQGDVARARALLTDCLALAQRLGNPHRVAQTLEGVAAYAAQLGRAAAARRFANAALGVRASIDAPSGPMEQRMLDRRLRGVGSAREGSHWSLDQACALAFELLQVPPPEADLVQAHGPLTPREAQVAALVTRGLSNREIARALTIAERTATSHVEHVLAKLGFHSRAQIAAWVVEQRQR